MSACMGSERHPGRPGDNAAVIGRPGRGSRCMVEGWCCWVSGGVHDAIAVRRLRVPSQAVLRLLMVACRRWRVPVACGLLRGAMRGGYSTDRFAKLAGRCGNGAMACREPAAGAQRALPRNGSRIERMRPRIKAAARSPAWCYEVHSYSRRLDGRYSPIWSLNSGDSRHGLHVPIGCWEYR